MVTAKNDFKLLLKETKLISYKSHDMINESDKHYKDIVDVLKVKLNHKHLTLLYSEGVGFRGICKSGLHLPVFVCFY